MPAEKTRNVLRMSHHLARMYMIGKGLNIHKMKPKNQTRGQTCGDIVSETTLKESQKQ
jgi:hypothetical protein